MTREYRQCCSEAQRESTLNPNVYWTSASHSRVSSVCLHLVSPGVFPNFVLQNEHNSLILLTLQNTRSFILNIVTAVRLSELTRPGSTPIKGVKDPWQGTAVSVSRTLGVPKFISCIQLPNTTVKTKLSVFKH